jgi:hypothetical protein
MAKQYVLECKECGSHKVLVSLWGECDEDDGSYQLSEWALEHRQYGDIALKAACWSPQPPSSVGWCAGCDKVIGQEFEHKFVEVPA